MSVTTRNFDTVLKAGDPVSQAKIYYAQSADEIMCLNIDGPMGINSAFFSVLEKLSQDVFIPITAGGGITTIDQVRTILKSGADKVCIGSQAIRSPEFISKVVSMFGSQACIVAIDYSYTKNGDPVVKIDCGKKAAPISLLDWIELVQNRLPGEIMLTCIDRDGEKIGIDLDLVRSISSRVLVPFIVSGGVGKANHFIEALGVDGVDAVSAGTFFCFSDQNQTQTRSLVRNAGIRVRTELVK